MHKEPIEPGAADSLERLADYAVALLVPGQVVGLGSGRTSAAFVRRLGQRIRAGLAIRGIPTSEHTRALAQQEGIPLTSLDDVAEVDITVDGADEVAPSLDIIKGRGGALLREKVVAAASRQVVILAQAYKLSPLLGSRGLLPIEVVPFAARFVCRRLEALGITASLRLADDRPFTTDNGNYLLDCHVGPILSPRELEQTLHAIPGVVTTGLFIGMAHLIVLAGTDGLVELRRPQK